MVSKFSIRKDIRGIRDAIAPDAQTAAGDAACRNLLALETVRDARSWFVYVSRGSEIGTHELIHRLIARGNEVTVPFITPPDTMAPRRIRSFAELQLSDLGFLEPVHGSDYELPIDVCVCPGLAFTEQGDRLGTGRGFYDRYLATRRPRLAVGLAYEAQIVPELPAEMHDRRMDLVVTEERIIRPQRF